MGGGFAEADCESPLFPHNAAKLRNARNCQLCAIKIDVNSHLSRAKRRGTAKILPFRKTVIPGNRDAREPSVNYCCSRLKTLLLPTDKLLFSELLFFSRAANPFQRLVVGPALRRSPGTDLPASRCVRSQLVRFDPVSRRLAACPSRRRTGNRRGSAFEVRISLAGISPGLRLRDYLVRGYLLLDL